MDKILAFAFRPNRIKHRDLWDMAWLHQLGITPRFELLSKKLNDRDILLDAFKHAFDNRYMELKADKKLIAEFRLEMSRFLPGEQLEKVLQGDGLWAFIIYLVDDLKLRMTKFF